MKTKEITIEEYDYQLPEDRIASHPLINREDCKLLVRDENGFLSECKFKDIGDHLKPNSLLVVNNTRVINARMKMKKEKGDAVIEIFCLEPVEPFDYEMNFSSKGVCQWRCLVGNSKKWKSGPVKLTLPLADREARLELKAERISKEDKTSIIQFSWIPEKMTFSDILSMLGEIPIPPYLNRVSEESDKTDYQTIYSRVEGSVAAPTAGLHFTDSLFKNLKNSGIDKRELTLHVGAGTFQPVKAKNIGEHEMHKERISVDIKLIEELSKTDRPIIAVGTTSVRTLESLYHYGRMVKEGRNPEILDQWYAYDKGEFMITRKEALESLTRYIKEKGDDSFVAETQILIAPGYEFRMVDGIITNFHQPKSTLLLLVSAFIGEGWRLMYDYAIDNGYRFLSYGDGMLLLRPKS